MSSFRWALMQHNQMQTDVPRGKGLREKTALCKLGREAWNRSSLPAVRRNQPCPHLDPGHPASRTMRINVCSLSPPIYGALSWPPQETTAAP